MPQASSEAFLAGKLFPLSALSLRVAPRAPRQVLDFVFMVNSAIVLEPISAIPRRR